MAIDDIITTKKWKQVPADEWKWALQQFKKFKKNLKETGNADQAIETIGNLSPEETVAVRNKLQELANIYRQNVKIADDPKTPEEEVLIYDIQASEAIREYDELLRKIGE